MTTGQGSPAEIDGRPDRLRTVRHRGIAFGIAIALAGLAVAVAVPPRGTQAAAASARRSAGAVTTLPAPFDQWDVELGRRRGEEGALTLGYTSPALGRRTENTVYLPTSYSSDGPPLAILYFLHGTVAPPLDNPALDPATSQEFLLDMVASGGGDIQTRLQNFAAQRHHAHFVVVALDTARAGNWCQTCVWINGIKPTIQGQPPFSARTVPAETILETEVRPLVEHLLNVRSDRGGRGISGFSMGAVGALIQALRHPDEYAYVAAISGPINFVDDPFWRTWVDFVGYLHDQGYGYSATDADRWRTINPSDLIQNLAGAGTPVTITAGDGCVGPADEVGRRDCDRYPALRNPFAASIETQMRRNNDTYAAAVAAGGVNADQLRFPGVHGANNPRVYADVIVPAANDAFARARPVAETFSYRNGDPTFSVWGYTVDTHRTGSAVFTTLDARHDGAAFAVTGTGSLEVTTPPTFRPGQPYSVRTWGSALTPRIVQADGDGRIRLDRLLLPPPGSAPGRIAVAITPA